MCNQLLQHIVQIIVDIFASLSLANDFVNSLQMLNFKEGIQFSSANIRLHLIWIEDAEMSTVTATIIIIINIIIILPIPMIVIMINSNKDLISIESTQWCSKNKNEIRRSNGRWHFAVEIPSSDSTHTDHWVWRVVPDYSLFKVMPYPSHITLTHLWIWIMYFLLQQIQKQNQNRKISWVLKSIRSHHDPWISIMSS